MLCFCGARQCAVARGRRGRRRRAVRGGVHSRRSVVHGEMIYGTCDHDLYAYRSARCVVQIRYVRGVCYIVVWIFDLPIAIPKNYSIRRASHTNLCGTAVLYSPRYSANEFYSTEHGGQRSLTHDAGIRDPPRTSTTHGHTRSSSRYWLLDVHVAYKGLTLG